MKTNPLLLIAFCLMFGSYNSTNAQGTEKKCSHTPIQVKEVDGQKTLVMKADVPMSAISEKMGEMYGALFTYMQTQKITPAGPAFAIYYSWDPNGNTIFEAGVAIAESVAGNDTIVYKEFPVMKAVTTLFTGAYTDFGVVYGDLQKYMEDNKLESTGQTWEVYLTDPSSVKDPSQNQTLIYFPLK